MSITQFLRILWAYRTMVAVLTAACLVVSGVVVQFLPPRYEAQSRVMLDIIKPDPVTGQVMATAFLRAYTKTQIELVRDPQTARLVVSDLNWAADPVMLRKYRESRSDDLDFERWAAQEISEGASARLIEGSNILEITYSSDSPARAKQVADSLRKAYLETTLQSRREAARRNAEWYEGQASKSRSILFQAEKTKADFERENGILLGDDKVDIDSARLAALATSGGGAFIAPSSSGASPSALQLSRMDAELLEASKVMGPNHPQLQQMRQQRELLARQVAQERDAVNSASASALSAQRATSGLLEAQKAKVLAQREKIERLRLMQDEIDLRREQYNNAVARAAQLRQEADVAEAGATPLASAITPQAPVFPNKPMIVGAAVGGGAVIGILGALLLEIFGRRIRSLEDLAGAVEAPVLAIIRPASVSKSRKFKLPKLQLANPLRTRTSRT
ncbi:exopolysaccharide biosynthesis protein EpsF [Phenylobacterium kunshanense]|uniref:Exopolysaccharide biosynthesis protein EpsF n=1 Tax=Phenylobacterium kunshanense TaxID=1445034 RepID=A0A328BH06_9CAUL|nr:exopolysaccharide biosynthesis protein EpsF [Phenylobacterium kunshanense]RAK66530.1 exopolysaccharide biosynthesis protein EpsF [Phenylobacterium kunshanense]